MNKASTLKETTAATRTGQFVKVLTIVTVVSHHNPRALSGIDKSLQADIHPVLSSPKLLDSTFPKFLPLSTPYQRHQFFSTLILTNYHFQGFFSMSIVTEYWKWSYFAAFLAVSITLTAVAAIHSGILHRIRQDFDF